MTDTAMTTQHLATASADSRKLREFALVVSTGFLLLFTALPWTLHKSPQLWPVGLAALLGAIALVHPAWLAPLYQFWMRAGQALGWVNSRLILGILFYVVITPIGLAMRALGKDPLHLSIDRDATTYRACSRPRTPQSMERPY